MENGSITTRPIMACPIKNVSSGSKLASYYISCNSPLGLASLTYPLPFPPIWSIFPSPPHSPSTLSPSPFLHPPFFTLPIPPLPHPPRSHSSSPSPSPLFLTLAIPLLSRPHHSPSSFLALPIPPIFPVPHPPHSPSTMIFIGCRSSQTMLLPTNIWRDC